MATLLSALHHPQTQTTTASSKNGNARSRASQRQQRPQSIRILCVNHHEQPVPTLLDVAHQLAQSGNWEGARVSFQHAVAQLQQRISQQQDHDNNDTTTVMIHNNNQLQSIDNYELAAALADLASCCAQLGLRREAAAHWERSLELKRGYYNYYDPEVRDHRHRRLCCHKNLDLASALEVAGNAHAYCGDYVTAQRYFHEALDMKRLVYGKQQQPSPPPQQEAQEPSCGDDPGYSDPPDWLGRVDSPTGTAGTMTTQQQRPSSYYNPDNNNPLFGIKQQVYGYDRAQNSDVASTLTRLGQLATLQGRYHTARKRYAEALDMLRRAHHGNEFHVDIAQVLALLGQCHAAQQQQQQKQHNRPTAAASSTVASTYLDRAVQVMQTIVQTTPYHNITDGSTDGARTTLDHPARDGP